VQPTKERADVVEPGRRKYQPGSGIKHRL